MFIESLRTIKKHCYWSVKFLNRIGAVFHSSNLILSKKTCQAFFIKLYNSIINNNDLQQFAMIQYNDQCITIWLCNRITKKTQSQINWIVNHFLIIFLIHNFLIVSSVFALTLQIFTNPLFLGVFYRKL
jgi:hypothetical protein